MYENGPGRRDFRECLHDKIMFCLFVRNVISGMMHLGPAGEFRRKRGVNTGTRVFDGNEPTGVTRLGGKRAIPYT